MELYVSVVLTHLIPKSVVRFSGLGARFTGLGASDSKSVVRFSGLPDSIHFVRFSGVGASDYISFLA